MFAGGVGDDVSRPVALPMSTRPGYTVIPAPSITWASGGIAAFAPTASISPLRMITLPDAIGAPAAVTMRAPLMA
jgi:hypothetical protein